MAAGLYIHVPFCRSKCAYCSFYSLPEAEREIPRFLEALRREMAFHRRTFRSFDTVYFGGGTPSLLTPEQVGRTIEDVRHSFRIAPDAEITIEMNPADWTAADLRKLHEIGVNRLNIGVQSLDDGILAFLGRRHTAEQALRAVRDAEQVGFGNLGIDLMYGIPGQDPATWLETLAAAVALPVAHLSCYELTVEPDTTLGRRYAKKLPEPAGESRSADFFLATSRFLAEAGYLHYEVSNFARGTLHVSRHNSKYWRHVPYLGLGPSAHSFRETRRWWNVRSLTDYLAAVDSARPPVSAAETLSREQMALEARFLALRTARGLHMESYRRKYGTDLKGENGPLLRKLAEEGLVEMSRGFLRPTRAGLAVADRLALL
ncbi:MAG: radical SAM family heme chaperone HemW [Syntrophaceae bacterium]|nr:radical SAM family heme chaperone HemW [Syntrophaceae bacterium]